MQKILPIIEILIITLSFFISAFIFNINVNYEYLYILIISSFVFILLSYTYNLYKSQNLFKYLINAITIWVIIAGVIFASIFIFKLENSGDFGRKFIIFWLVLSPILLTIWRIIFRKISRTNPTNILIIDNNYQWTKFEKQKLKKQNINIFHNNYNDNNILNFVKNNNIKQIVIDNNIDIKTLTHLNLNNIKILTFTHFMEKYLRKCYLDGDLNYLDEIKKFDNKQNFIKNIIDYFGSLMLIALTLPIMLFSIIKIKKESPGKVIFKQKRVGIFGKEFTVYKFRSMFENSQFDPYTKKNDSRIFPYGNFMRKTRIDELPQLFNILGGKMSLVGSRAEWDILVENYEKKLPYYNLRHLIKPGISGWAQVNYPYGENIEDTKQKLMYDLYYIKNWSVALEFETIFKTILVVAYKKGL
jgi:exopolysaccharide biosynthesis polyprenyl glycosylphosphotransferase